MTALGGASQDGQSPAPVAVELPITLGQFVKLAGLATTGGDAKLLVAAGLVRVNSAIETRRGRKLTLGDVVASGEVTTEVARRAHDPAEG